jgi:hypothetical protein
MNIKKKILNLGQVFLEEQSARGEKAKSARKRKRKNKTIAMRNYDFRSIMK